MLGTTLPSLSFRRCPARFSAVKESRQEDFVAGSDMLGKRLGYRVGAGGSGGTELRVLLGLYTFGREYEGSSSEGPGEL